MWRRPCREARCLVVVAAPGRPAAAAHGQTESALFVSETGDIAISAAMHLSVEQVGEARAAGASLDGLLRTVAAHNPDPEVTLEVLRAGASLGGRDAHGWTALMYAAAFNPSATVADALLAAGARRRTSGAYEPLPSVPWVSFDALGGGFGGPVLFGSGTPALAFGSEHGGLMVLGADMQPFNFHWFWILELSAALADLKLQGGEPALFAAAAYNRKPAMTLSLIDHGSDVNASLADGTTALMIAAGLNSEPEVVKNLLSAGAQVNSRTETSLTALMAAARYNGNPLIVQELVAAGADLEARDDRGRTAFVHAAMASDPAPLRALIEAGADVLVRVGQDADTAITYAARYNPGASLVLETLVDGGVELNARDRHGWTALMKVAAYGSADPGVVWTLANLGADPALTNRAGRTALDLMRDNPRLHGTDAYWWLSDRSAGASVDLTPAAVAKLTVEEVTAAIADGAPVASMLLEVACYNRNPAVTRALLDAGAPTNYGGWTALMNAAALNPNPAVVQEMLDAGAQLLATNPYEPTPWCVHPNPDYQDAINLVSVLAEDYQYEGLYGGETALFAAAAYNENPAVLQALVDAGAELDARTPYGGVTALMLAAAFNRNPDMVRTSIAAGADPNDEIEDGAYSAYGGQTALMAAASYNPNPEVLQALLEAGADVQAATRDGWTALMAAASRRLPEYGDGATPAFVQQLLAAGAPVDARDSRGRTALMAAAASQEDPAIVRQLLAAGAQVDARDRSGRTALMAAAWNRANVRALLAGGADLDARDDDGNTPLHAAAGNRRSAEALLTAGADLQARNDAGETVLIKAAQRDAVPTMAVLLAAGAPLEMRDGAGTTALIAAARSGNSNAVEALLAAGAALEARDDTGRTALTAATEYRYGPGAVRTLLAAGARLEARDFAGDTALMAAARGRRSEIAELLLAAGADTEARNQRGETALIAAVADTGEYTSTDTYRAHGSPAELALVRILLAAGADPHAHDAQGATALMHVSGAGSQELVELLFETGIDLDAQDHAGRSALLWAAATATAEVVELLLDLGADATLPDDAGDTAWDLIQHNEAVQGTQVYRRLRDLHGRTGRE